MPHIPQQEFVKEHKKLINVLERGTRQEQKKEAKKQSKELQSSSGIVQSVILSREHFKSLDAAKKWLNEHEFHDKGVDITPQYFRFRQRSPEGMKNTHRFRSIELKGVGYMIMAYPK